MAPGLGKLILIGAKLLGRRLEPTEGIPLTDTAREAQVAEEELAPEARARLAGVIAELQGLGFHSPQFSTPKESLLTGIYAAVVSLLHESGEAVAHIAYARATLVHPPLEKVHVSFQTWLMNGAVLATTNGPPQMDPLPGHQVVRRTGKSIASTWHAHRQRLEGVRPRPGVKPILSVADLWSHLEAEHPLAPSAHLARGVWVEMTPEEVEALRAKRRVPPPLPGDVDPAVWAELERLQQPKQNWGMAVVIFALSLALFLLAGSAQWNWGFALMLVPVLLVHELGHYAAMRCFRYQNLRVFFIPFFGAAVSGFRLQAAGWKKAVVALAGPVPGIIIGGALELIAGDTGIQWLEKLGRLFVVINGFNLLPLQPLDGGRVFDAVFYVRSRWLELLSVVVAALGLMALSGMKLGKLFLFLGLVMLFSLPHVSRIGRIVAQLKRKRIGRDPEDAPRISRESARAILAEARAVLPARSPLPAKTLAGIVMNAYERLHTRPPGFFASATLLGCHGASAIVALFVFLFSPFYSSRQIGRLIGEMQYGIEPKLVHACAGGIATSGATTALSSNRVTLIATFTNAALARDAFQRLQTNPAGPPALTLLGQSVFLSAEPGAADWEGAARQQLAPLAARTVVETPRSNRLAVVHLRAVAKSQRAARRLEASLQEYFLMPAAFLLRPPWADTNAISAGDLARERKARYTYRELERTRQQVTRSPEYRAFEPRVRQALAHKDTNALHTIAREQQSLLENRSRELQQQLLQSKDPEIDPATVAAYQQRPRPDADSAAWTRWHRDFGRRLGQVPLQDGRPAGPVSDLIVHGSVTRKGAQLTIAYATFARCDRGLPALAQFLCAAGCDTIYYDFEEARAGRGEEE